MGLHLWSCQYREIAAAIVKNLQYLFSTSSSCSSSSSSFKAKPVHVLIVSSWRSGSSFIGQIFNHHKDVFYLFEPGHPVWMKFQMESSELLTYPNPNLNLRIIHLVRDPRAVALSRKGFPLTIEDSILLKNEGVPKNKNLIISQVMRKVCNAQVVINKLARTDKSLDGRYMVLRHEDLARNPLESITQMYNFSKLQLTEDMKQWMYNITHTEIKGLEQFMTFSKNSFKVITRWRTGADFNLVNQIQQMCKGAMKAFGYLPVKTKKEQENMAVEVIKEKWSQTEDSTRIKLKH
ncbi:carbohydrate sulfotransferase 6-like isoform X2 [Hyla sarda]|uniref:carbohydrate sulfotransferase 6-like isoform X2 n=1 Tax=Hyla sarda TaxID=327740 RepID=UPI0024C2D25E|nr:carbohydrate sulfotransferase 6-like isoform X2 [Hyla sarda]